jgi:hypothetical protein
MGSCSLPQEIASGDYYECEFEANVTGGPGDTMESVATAEAEDSHGQRATDHDGATVTFVDGPSSILVSKGVFPAEVPEPGAEAAFTVLVENTSQGDSVTIESVVDDIFGDIGASCDMALPADLAPGELLTCIFVEFVAGQPGDVHMDTVTVTGTDDDGVPVSGQASSQVTFSDVASSVTVSKTSDPTSVEAPGGDVTFTVMVENTSAVDDVTVLSVMDDMYGDVGASCDMALPALLAPGESLSCVFTRVVAGDGGEVHSNLVTVTVIDDDGVDYTGEAGTTVAITEPPVTIYKIYIPIVPKNYLP